MIKKYLEQIVSAITSHGNILSPYSSTYDFVLKNGHSMKQISSDHGYKIGPQKNCYQNAVETSLAYVEGYAIHKAPIPLMHAWNIDSQRRVVDVTWPNNSDAQYYGVILPRWYVLKIILSKKHYGVIDNWQQNFPLLTGEHPWPLKKSTKQK